MPGIVGDKYGSGSVSGLMIGSRGGVPGPGVSMSPAGTGSVSDVSVASTPAIPQSVLNAISQPATNQVPAINNTAAANPQAQEANNALMQRVKGDMGAADAMRLSTVGIRDAASGLMKEMAGNRSRRGVSGTGVDSIQDASVANNALRDITGANSNIAFQSERAKDQQFTNVREGALGQDASNRADRQLALNQYDSANRSALEQQRLQQEKINSVLSLLRPSGGFF